MTVRAYLPTTIAVLAEQYEQGAFVVSDDVVVLASAADDEEAEYDALMTAAAVSAALVAGAGRRVVVVAELDRSPETGWTVPLKRVVAVHADTEDRPADADPDGDLGWFATQEIPQLLT
ncbi:hypothetical protein [Nocardioides sp.]|uniref:DUF6912 family protein n=1 Tax=Nocardioides sp. TaxID=35761 RepID=UPI002602DE80|nr:hypothetical protein [Nocardioides sp.]MDI6911927.1 hypothetical protein [Nocardioides sp.]